MLTRIALVLLLLLQVGCQLPPLDRAGATLPAEPQGPQLGPQQQPAAPAVPKLPDEPVARADVAELASQLQEGLVRVGRTLWMATDPVMHDELRNAHLLLRMLLIATRQWLLAFEEGHDQSAARESISRSDVEAVRERAADALALLPPGEAEAY